MEAKKQYNLARLIRRIILSKCYNSFLLPSSIRIKMLRLVGVNIGDNCFIGQFVFFDDLYPRNIFIGNNTIITSGTKILTHFYNPENKSFEIGEVHIGDNCFIGMNTLITKPITIGNNVTIGGGSVITKDIPDNRICAGVPCRPIKNINLVDK